jgi:hypothetical protein
MKLGWVILVLLSTTFARAQQNLVPNPSFEELTSCPTGSAQIHRAVPWINDVGGCEVYNECVEPTFIPPNHYQHRQDVPENSVGYQSAHSGEGYAGIFTYGGQFETNGREYLQVPLLEPLQSGGYLVSFWASLADKYQYSVTSLGAYFSDTLVTRTSFNSVLDFEPSVENIPTQNLSNKDIWYLVRDTFMSRYGGEEYLLIGNFRITEESNLFWVDSGAGNNWDRSYYYIDDVSVIALGDTVSGISEAEQLQFSVYPNPVVERVNIAGKERLHHVALFDIRGRKIMEEDAHNQKHTIDLKGIPEGVYLLRVTDDEGHTATQRLVKAAGL